MSHKTVSQLDQNGFFVCAAEAFESPLEPGVFHIPGGAVDEPPPAIPAGMTARWLDGWVFEPIPAAPAEQPPTAEELRAEAIADIEQRRDQALRAGVVLNGARYHTDETFLTELLGLLMGYQVGIYSGTQDIRTMDNTIVQLTVQEITAVAAAVGTHRKAVYAQSWAEKDAL